MEKERFLTLARNYTSLTAEDTAELDLLQKEFPFSQIIHNLKTRGSQDNQMPSAHEALHLSAIYTTDRAVLKALITAPKSNRAEEVLIEPTSPVSIRESPDPSGFVSSHLSGDELINEVMSDLNRLQELKANFEVSFQAFNKSNPPETRTTMAGENTLKGAVAKTSSSPGHLKKTSTKGDGEDKLKAEPPVDVLLEEIKTTKKKIVPESPKQKEQIEIIDQFIKKQPSISKNTTGAPDSQDLAETSISLTDNIVSETLVEILLKQGKKDKAIEVLKKLIWKFPQKKSIFAAQIEELKK